MLFAALLELGTINRSSIKNPSTRFTICLFSEIQDSNPVVYAWITYAAYFLPLWCYYLLVCPVWKDWSARCPVCDKILQSGVQHFYHTSVRGYILFWNKQSFALVISLIGWLKDLKSSSTRSFQIPRFETRSSLKIGFVPSSSGHILSCRDYRCFILST